MTTAIDRLRQELAIISDLGAIEGLLGWDQQTMMPPRGAGARANHLATLAAIQHERFTSPAAGSLLDAAEAETAGLDSESDDACLLRVTRRDWEKARRAPADLVSAMAHAAAEGYAAWTEAKQASNFTAFLPALERNIELRRRYVTYFEGEPYDVLLDDFEPGLTAAEVSAVFDRLKARLVPLIARVSERAVTGDEGPFAGHFPADQQRELVVRIISRLGYEEQGWRLDPTEHPFAQSLASTDVRLATRYDESNLAMALFGTIHECGHGLYEAGVDPALDRTPLGHGCSMALHESQSRLYENVIGRGRPFWRFAYPLLREAFPEHFAGFDEETVYRAANRMGPSLIRVEADEATYPLHIVLRFELERDLFEGRLQPAGLPEAWNAKMREYLGVDVPDDARGVLQDVHWSAGLFGYFPTYALGAVIAVQIWERLQAELPETDERMSTGEFGEIRAWLRDRLHRHGRKFPPAETIARVAGGPIDPEPFLRYLTTKIDALYGA